MQEELKLEENFMRLNNLKNLKKGWNGYDADPFTKFFIDKIIELLPELNRQPELFPTARDSIQFEYTINFENYPNTYVEIEIWEDSFSIFIQNDEERFTAELDVSEVISASAINEIITGSYKGVRFI